jgi:hypothetical protein
MSRADAIAALTYLIPHWRKGQGAGGGNVQLWLLPTSRHSSSQCPRLFTRPPSSIDLCRRPSGGANGADNEPPPKLLALVGMAGKALDKSLQAIQKETLRSGLDV